MEEFDDQSPGVIMTTTEFGAFLSRLASEKGYSTHRSLATRLQASNGHIFQLLRGRASFTIDMLQRIFSCLGVPCEISLSATPNDSKIFLAVHVYGYGEMKVYPLPLKEPNDWSLRVIAYRKQQGLTQKQFGALVGAIQSEVSTFELHPNHRNGALLSRIQAFFEHPSPTQFDEFDAFPGVNEKHFFSPLYIFDRCALAAATKKRGFDNLFKALGQAHKRYFFVPENQWHLHGRQVIETIKQASANADRLRYLRIYVVEEFFFILRGEMILPMKLSYGQLMIGSNRIVLEGNDLLEIKDYIKAVIDRIEEQYHVGRSVNIDGFTRIF